MNLRVLAHPGFQTLLRELTWPEADQNFIDLLTLIQNAGGEDFPDVSVYDPLFLYTPDFKYVTFNGNLWQNISLTDHTGVTPGTDANVWKNSSVGELAHAQNTDFKHARAIGYTSEPGNISLWTNRIYNYIVINRNNAPGGVEYAIDITSKNVSGTSFVDHEFYIVLPHTADFTVRLTNTANLYVGINDIVMVPGDSLKVLGHTDTPTGVKTKVVSHTKIASGANPFNQSLDTTDSVTFAGAKITGRTPGNVAVYGADGALTELLGFKVENGNLVLPATLVMDLLDGVLEIEEGVVKRAETILLDDIALPNRKYIDQGTLQMVTTSIVNGQWVIS